MNAKLTNSIRKAVYCRDGFQCCICGCHRFLQIHHAIPRGQGGNNTPHNLITLCSDCHALAHGINLVGHPDLDTREINMSILEYLADMYQDEEHDWKAWGE